MTTRLAKVRFIADSTQASFRGSNSDEQDMIDKIRKTYAPYLFSDNPPAELLTELGMLAVNLIDNSGFTDRYPLAVQCIAMYETETP